MRSLARVCVALIVLVVSVIAFPAATFAGWESANVTAANIKKVCTDGIKFDGAVRDGEGPTGDYRSWAVVTGPPPPDTPAPPPPSSYVVIRTRIKIPKLTNPKDVLPGSDILLVSHLRSFDMRFYDELNVGDTISLNLEDSNPDASPIDATVKDCKI